MAAGLPLIKNVLTSIAKNFFAQIGLAAGSAKKSTIQKTFLVHWRLHDHLKWRDGSYYKMVKSFEESALMIKGGTETIKNRAKKTKKWISWHVTKYISCKFIKKYMVRKSKNTWTRTNKSRQWDN